mgnify:CR=1 FL=1
MSKSPERFPALLAGALALAAVAAGRAGGQMQDALAVERAAVTAKLAAIPPGADVFRNVERACWSYRPLTV